MKLIRIDQIIGNEVLARPIMTSDYKELLAEGTVLKASYIPKLAKLGVVEVFIKDDKIDSETRRIIKEEVNNKCRERVKEIISKHLSNDAQSMTEIAHTAESIVATVMEQGEVVEQIYDIKERSADLYEHCINTCALAALVGLKLGLERQMVYDISIGCLLHDLGLKSVTTDFQNKDPEEFSSLEREDFYKHSIYGYNIVKTEKWLSKISKQIILFHHEALDGSGYPLHNMDISMPTKVAAVCDYFDECLCGVGRRRKKVYEIVEYLKAFKGTKFDAQVIDVILDFTAVYPSGSKVITSEGDMAVVIRQNNGFPERPVIQLIADRNRKLIQGTVVRDLLQYTSLFIEKEIN